MAMRGGDILKFIEQFWDEDYIPPPKGTWLYDYLTEEKSMSDQLVDVLKNDVVQILVTEYDFLLEDAENEVEESTKTDQGMWNVNAEAKDIAKYLASDDKDE